MYERMLNKQVVPTEDEIKEYIGKKSVENIDLIKKSLEKIYDINFELRFHMVINMVGDIKSVE